MTRGAVLAVAIADLAEARAEVATLRGHVKLLSEWQEHKRRPIYPDESMADRMEAFDRLEARMLAADLSEEVGRG